MDGTAWQSPPADKQDRNNHIMLDRIRHGFFAKGWLIPAFIPVAIMLGRAPGNILLGIYFIWALLALRSRDMKVPRVPTVLWFLVIVTFVLGITEAVIPDKAFRYWLKFTVYSSVFFITFAALKQQAGPGKLVRVLGMSSIAVIIILVLKYIYLIGRPDFSPATQISGVWAAYLLPFGLFYLLSLNHQHKKYIAATLIVLTIIVLLMIDSRTEVLAVLFALGVFWAFWKRRFIPAMAVILLLLPVVIIVDATPFSDRIKDKNLLEMIDEASSLRTLLWRKVLENPPDNSLIGVGMHNARYSPAAEKVGVKHLHNVFLDIWYETGWLGLCAILMFSGYFTYIIFDLVRDGNQERRVLLVPWIASITAVLVCGFLDRYYLTKDFSFFLFFCLAVVLYIYRENKNNNKSA